MSLELFSEKPKRSTNAKVRKAQVLGDSAELSALGKKGAEARKKKAEKRKAGEAAFEAAIADHVRQEREADYARLQAERNGDPEEQL